MTYTPVPHLLSIQSHVAYGHVGNSAAVFPLQRSGFEVTAINTVQFSNHTGYGEFKGDIFEPSHLRTILDGVEDRGALKRMQALLTGYLGDEHTGEVVVDALERIRRDRPEALYCCDPVMGDVGRGFFVKPGLPEWIRDYLIPHADIITPNQFELGFLAGMEIDSMEDALEAAAKVRARGPKQVLVTSLEVDEVGNDQIALLLDNAEGSWLVATPKLEFPIPLNGAGDATSALFLAQLLKNSSPEEALEHTAAAVFSIFQVTHELGERELQLVAAQNAFLKPELLFPSRQLR